MCLDVDALALIDLTAALHVAVHGADALLSDERIGLTSDGAPWL